MPSLLDNNLSRRSFGPCQTAYEQRPSFSQRNRYANSALLIAHSLVEWLHSFLQWKSGI